MGVANICCDGKIVSVLEGGYGELKVRLDDYGAVLGS